MNSLRTDFLSFNIFIQSKGYRKISQINTYFFSEKKTIHLQLLCSRAVKFILQDYWSFIFSKNFNYLHQIFLLESEQQIGVSKNRSQNIKQMNQRKKPVSTKNEEANILSVFQKICSLQIGQASKVIKKKIAFKCNALFFLLLLSSNFLEKTQFLSLQGKINKVLGKKIKFKERGILLQRGRYQKSLQQLLKYKNAIDKAFSLSNQSLAEWNELLNEVLKESNWANLGIQSARQELNKKRLSQWNQLTNKYLNILEKAKQENGRVLGPHEKLKYFLNFGKKQKQNERNFIEISCQNYLEMALENDNQGTFFIQKNDLQTMPYGIKDNLRLVIENDSNESYQFFECEQWQTSLLPINENMLEQIEILQNIQLQESKESRIDKKLAYSIM